MSGTCSTPPRPKLKTKASAANQYAARTLDSSGGPVWHVDILLIPWAARASRKHLTVHESDGLASEGTTVGVTSTLRTLVENYILGDSSTDATADSVFQSLISHRWISDHISYGHNSSSSSTWVSIGRAMSVSPDYVIPKALRNYVLYAPILVLRAKTADRRR
jgi:hypothetical protein